MTSVGRMYVAVGAVLLFFVLWATIAANPWTTAAGDPGVDALARRETVVRQRAAAAQQRYDARWAAYRAALAARKASATVSATAPPVRIVQVPPLATTRSS